MLDQQHYVGPTALCRANSIIYDQQHCFLVSILFQLLLHFHLLLLNIVHMFSPTFPPFLPLLLILVAGVQHGTATLPHCLAHGLAHRLRHGLMTGHAAGETHYEVRAPPPPGEDPVSEGGPKRCGTSTTGHKCSTDLVTRE